MNKNHIVIILLITGVCLIWASYAINWSSDTHSDKNNWLEPSYVSSTCNTGTTNKIDNTGFCAIWESLNNSSGSINSANMENNKQEDKVNWFKEGDRTWIAETFGITNEITQFTASSSGSTSVSSEKLSDDFQKRVKELNDREWVVK